MVSEDKKSSVAKMLQSQSSSGWENHVTMEYQCESLENSGNATQCNHSKRRSQIELCNNKIIKGNQEFQEKISLLGKRTIADAVYEQEENQELILNTSFKTKHMKCSEAR